VRKTDRPPLDRLDFAILERYQRDTQLAAGAIGRAVGLSAAAVQRRLKRLREAGVIEREAAQLDPAALGLTVMCVVNVRLARDHEADLARFRRQAAATPEVQQCYYVTGPNDFVLIVVAADVPAYEAFTRGPLLTDGNVRKFTTHVVLGRAKVGLDVPLGLAKSRPEAPSGRAPKAPANDPPGTPAPRRPPARRPPGSSERSGSR
jgi:Lrp/AsnC family transcriptional regulator, leucine-responsive regulatory protein